MKHEVGHVRPLRQLQRAPASRPARRHHVWRLPARQGHESDVFPERRVPATNYSGQALLRQRLVHRVSSRLRHHLLPSQPDEALDEGTMPHQTRLRCRPPPTKPQAGVSSPSRNLRVHSAIPLRANLSQSLRLWLSQTTRCTAAASGKARNRRDAEVQPAANGEAWLAGRPAPLLHARVLEEHGLCTTVRSVPWDGTGQHAFHWTTQVVGEAAFAVPRASWAVPEHRSATRV
jgi:hypothetical protein